MTIEKDKNLLRLEIIKHVEDYLAKGKKINQIPFGEQNEDFHKGRRGKSGRNSGKPLRNDFFVK